MKDSRYHCKTCGDWNTYTEPPPADSSPIIFRCMNCGAKGEMASGAQAIEWGPSRWTPEDTVPKTYPFTLDPERWSKTGWVEGEE